MTEATVAKAGGRSFWLHRAFTADDAGEEGFAILFNAAFDALDAEHVPGDGGPVGLCHLVDPRRAARRREAVWADTGLRYEGYLPDGDQVRLRYFAGAIAVRDPFPAAERPQVPPDVPWWELFPLGDDYRVEEIGASAVGTEDILDLWASDGAVLGDEAARRVHEVRLVGVRAADGALAGITTASLVREPQLRMDLWEIRAYVGAEHRRSNIAMHLTNRSAEALEQRFVSGEDPSGSGIFIIVQNEGLRRMFPEAIGALWPHMQYVRDDSDGAAVAVHFFPGALAPPPS